MSRYLNPSALVAVRYLTAERLRWRRPRQAARVRSYTPALRASVRLDVVHSALDGLHRLEAAR